MKRLLRSLIVSICTLSLVVGAGAEGAVAHDPIAGHVVAGEVVTTQGTLRVDIREGLPDTGGTAWFTPAGGRRVEIDIDCVHVEFFVDVYFTYSLLMPVVPYYAHVVYASGRGSDGKRYRLQLNPIQPIGPVTLTPTILTRPARKFPAWARGPCGTAMVFYPPDWVSGGIFVLA